MAEGFLQLLLVQVDEDEDEHCQVKALYALSCIARSDPASLEKLSELDGWSVLLRALQRDSVKLRTKAGFFISSAAQVSHKVAQQMADMGLVVQLAAILHQQLEGYHEHVISALASLITRSPTAREEARAESLNLETLLRERLEAAGEKEELAEYIEHCKAVLTVLAPEFIPSEDWEEVGEWQAVPAGCQVRMDLETGKKMARRNTENTDR